MLELEFFLIGDLTQEKRPNKSSTKHSLRRNPNFNIPNPNKYN